MAIRQDAEKYFDGTRTEKELAKALDESFDITYRNTLGELSYWFADPKPHTKVRFGLNQEILVIYSYHIKTDARTLTAIENITRIPEFKHRLDRVLFILIHNGSIEETNELLKTSVDRIIVPFHCTELEDKSRGDIFVRSRIAASVGVVDLFGMSSAITSDKFFFGRTELTQSLVNRCFASKENSGLFGLRKTGKTSVLRAIQRRLDGRPILTEYIECSNPGIHAARWWQLLDNIAHRCQQTLSKEFKRKVSLSSEYEPVTAGAKFLHDIKETLACGEFEVAGVYETT